MLGRDGRRVDGAERLMGPISMNGSEGIVVVSSLSLDCIALGCVGRGCAGGLAREKRTVAVGCHGCSIKFGKKSSFDTLLCARAGALNRGSQKRLALLVQGASLAVEGRGRVTRWLWCGVETKSHGIVPVVLGGFFRAGPGEFALRPPRPRDRRLCSDLARIGDDGPYRYMIVDPIANLADRKTQHARPRAPTPRRTMQSGHSTQIRTSIRDASILVINTYVSLRSNRQYAPR